MRSVVVFALLASDAIAKPCPPMGLGSQVVQLDTASVTADGGIVVVEVPEHSDAPAAPDRSKWRLRVNGKLAPAVAAPIAPGMVVYHPPAGATAFELLDDKAKVVGKAKIVAKPPPLLAAPRIRAVLSGRTTTKHTETFVDVEIDGEAPDGAAALVLAKPKGIALSWGPISGERDHARVYSTGSGCVTLFPKGTVRAQPGDAVVAFWIDLNGRRSPVSPVVIVEQART